MGRYKEAQLPPTTQSTTLHAILYFPCFPGRHERIGILLHCPATGAVQSTRHLEGVVARDEVDGLIQTIGNSQPIVTPRTGCLAILMLPCLQPHHC